MKVALERRRRLRRESTDAEAALWSLLRGRRFQNYKFRRQHPCGPFILDFYCVAHRLAIELDGGQHFDPAGQRYDERRSRYLANKNIEVLRFPTDLVFSDRTGMLAAIAGALGAEVEWM